MATQISAAEASGGVDTKELSDSLSVSDPMSVKNPINSDYEADGISNRVFAYQKFASRTVAYRKVSKIFRRFDVSKAYRRYSKLRNENYSLVPDFLNRSQLISQFSIYIAILPKNMLSVASRQINQPLRDLVFFQLKITTINVNIINLKKNRIGNQRTACLI